MTFMYYLLKFWVMTPHGGSEIQQLKVGIVKFLFKNKWS